MILLAGDCTGSAYIFTPRSQRHSDNDDNWSSPDTQRPVTKAPLYDLTFEVECGATVGSAATSPASDGSDAVDIFLPSYELNQVHALRLSATDSDQ